MLYTASFYAPQHWVGRPFRVSRHHPRGRRTQWEVLPFLYPPRELLRAYRAGELDFPAFALEYRRALDAECAANVAPSTPLRTGFQDWLEGVPALGDFTLLCFEAAGQPCHRLPLADWLLERVPGLQAGELR
jgi:uncharacterized protein YeaO (DUF488 family)